MTFRYFAYGSNMLTQWLRTRCPSARRIGKAEAADFELEFSKKSVDCSGKATLKCAPEGGHKAYGVLYAIEQCDQMALDKAEGVGKGYGRCDDFVVKPFDSVKFVEATCYLATRFETGLRPYDWYLALIVAGARQHGLDSEYIAHLSRVSYKEDGEVYRQSRRRALLALKESGVSDYRGILAGKC